ncbi:MAG: CDP-alcohol phosphatidyltransferase family protein [Limisphaerales bacterium]
MSEALKRRPIAVRSSTWAQKIAAQLVLQKIHPNTISVLSVFFASLSGASMIWARQQPPPLALLLFLLAALLIQARLLCNLFDGMVAVEGGLGSKSGEIYNELPDRLADSVILICAGYAAGPHWFAPTLGWAAALGSVLTAYVRALGASAGAGQQFCGPMAKQQRMFITTFACIIAGLEMKFHWPPRALIIALALIIIGTVYTTARRTRRVIANLEK